MGLQAPVQVDGRAHVVAGAATRVVGAELVLEVDQVHDRGGHHCTAPNSSSTRTWSRRRSINRQALELIASGAVPVADLITDRLPLERTVEGIHTVAAGEAIKVTVEPT